MFAIFYGIYNGIMAGINGIDKNYQNSKERAKAMKLGNVTYYSGGQLYLTENGRQVVKSWDRLTGHDVIRDIRNGKIYYDLTLIKKQQKVKEAIRKGETVYQTPNCITHKRSGLSCYLRDIQSHHLITEIRINKYSFYFDVTTGMLLRLIDGYDKSIAFFHERGNLNNEPLEYDKIIMYFNQRQYKLMHNINYIKHNENWIRDVYYLKDFIRSNAYHLYMNKDGLFVRDYYSEEEIIISSGYNKVNINTGNYLY